jgi:hypothetical protein
MLNRLLIATPNFKKKINNLIILNFQSFRAINHCYFSCLKARAVLHDNASKDYLYCLVFVFK